MKRASTAQARRSFSSFSNAEAYYIQLRLAKRREGIIKSAFAMCSLMWQFYAAGVA